ncbi:single-stranded DNA-binding protein [Pediococcus argentinicus]|uniref:single-stranded DNA-binding protein n=1 Tax=Pediococcus argentinicus TaxID=480391 RepID=UPI00338EA503
MRQITISGNLGGDPQINQTKKGSKVANFNVAVRQTRPNSDNKYESDWFRCSVWGTRSEIVEKYFHKGSHVVVTGSLTMSEYNGEKQIGVDVSDFDLPDNRTSNSNQTKPTAPKADDTIDISDDSLPF